MDGNGRWAKKRYLPRTAGHRAGVNTLRRIMEKADSLGVKYLTVYAFSTENWKRPIAEVDAIMNLLLEYLTNQLDTILKNNVKLMTIGDIEKIPDKICKKLKAAVISSSNNTGLVLTLALNYGGRSDIAHALKTVVSMDRENHLDLSKIDDTFIKQYMYTHFLPDPDLIIRTGGEERLSNFMPFESTYSEFYFCDTLWPDFTGDDLVNAINNFSVRQRRFGYAE